MKADASAPLVERQVTAHPAHGLEHRLDPPERALQPAPVLQVAHHGAGDLRAEVGHFHDDVIPAMTALRETADQIEVILPDDLWPLPTYREMLFIK